MKNKQRSVGRPKEFDETEVLNTVMSLFWKQGYEATGVADILTATGLAKGSLYKAFHSKHNLYLKSLAHYETTYVDAAVKALKANIPPYQRLDNFLSMPINDASNSSTSRGCFLCNASADRAQGDAETRALVLRGFDKLVKALVFVITQMKPGWNDDQHIQTAQMCLSVYSGLRIMSRSGVQIESLQNAKRGALRAFE